MKRGKTIVIEKGAERISHLLAMTGAKIIGLIFP